MPTPIAFVRCTADGACTDDGWFVQSLIEALGGTGQSARIVAPNAWRSLDPATRVVVDGGALTVLADDVDTLAARRAVVLLQHMTTLDSAPASGTTVLRTLQKELLGKFERVIVTGDASAERLRAEFGVAAEAIAVVAPGIGERVRSQGSGGPGCTILSIGPLIPSAGHELLLRALARLFDLDWQLTVVGDATLDRVHAATLAALVDELGVANRVVFPGQATADDLEALWRQADLFALAGAQDGYAITTAEALRRGVPLAIVAGDDAAKLVSADAGAVCVPGDRETLSKSLRRLIFDTTLRRSMSEAAWRIGQSLHDWPTQARAFAEAIGL